MEINDITDAMLVGRLFERMFAKGVVVVTTSNRAPDDLYKDGLNRHLFLPFIALIKDRLEVLELDGGVDHRLDRIAGQPVYISPLGPDATGALDRAWERMARGPGRPLELAVHGRTLTLPCFRAGVARASFDALCGQPLGPADYLAIAGAVDALILDDIPLMAETQRDQARRFVLLIDALYEARVQFVASAAAEPDRLYPAGTGAFAFQRTASRLEEMRSESWSRAARARAGD
jgi:cell division protein ZapE